MWIGLAAAAAGAAWWWRAREVTGRQQRLVWARLFELYGEPHADAPGRDDAGVAVPACPGARIWVEANGLHVRCPPRAAFVAWPQVRQVHASGGDGILVVVDRVGTLVLPGRIGHHVWGGMTAGHHEAFRMAHA